MTEPEEKSGGIQLKMTPELQQRILNNDPVAITILWESLLEPLSAYVCNQLKKRGFTGKKLMELTEEKTIAVVDRMLTYALKQYDPKRPFRNWAYTVANNVINNKPAKQKNLEQDLNLFEDATEMGLSVTECYESRPGSTLSDLRTALHRFKLDHPGYSHYTQILIDYLRCAGDRNAPATAAQIAAEMGVSEATVSRVKNFFRQPEIRRQINQYIGYDWTQLNITTGVPR